MKAPHVCTLRIDDILVEDQVRQSFDESTIQGLAENIKEVGQLQPVRVQKLGSGKYLLIDGERRLRAFRVLHRETITAIVEESELQPRDFLMQQLAANVHSESLTPIEKAKAFVKLMKLADWTAAAAASHLGISNANATRLAALLTLPEPIQARVHSGSIPFSAAYELSKIPDAAEQARQADSIERGDVTRDGLVAARRRMRQQTSEQPGKLVRSTALLEGGRSVAVSTPGDSLDAFIQALEECLQLARRARPTGASLTTFLKLLRDKSRVAV